MKNFVMNGKKEDDKDEDDDVKQAQTMKDPKNAIEGVDQDQDDGKGKSKLSSILPTLNAL